MSAQAIVALILSFQPQMDMTKAIAHGIAISQSCKFPETQSEIVSIIMIESSWRGNAKSKTGDYGLGQVNLEYWKKYFPSLSESALLNDRYNIAVACRILDEVFIRTQGKEGWPGYYHSSTKKLRERYIKRLEEVKHNAKSH